jgi:hypothetical protein
MAVDEKFQTSPNVTFLKKCISTKKANSIAIVFLAISLRPNYGDFSFVVSRGKSTDQAKKGSFFFSGGPVPKVHNII